MLDTFVVRSLLSPALMALCGRFNWWPSQMPPATRDIDAVGTLKPPSGGGGMAAHYLVERTS
eukprot:COSAG01_NODE_8179_length_2888_cov_2.436357_2_plen_62_part_00